MRLTKKKWHQLNNHKKDWFEYVPGKYSWTDIVYKLGELECLMEKYTINSVEELEHIILNDANGEQAFREYFETNVMPYRNLEQELGIDLVSLLNTKVIYIAKFSYWRWNIDSKQQCKKEDNGAQENKEIKEKKRFCVDFINKEIVVIETILASDDFDYKTKITRFPFSEYGKTWALTREELL